MCVFYPQIHQEMMEIALIDNFFEKYRRVQVIFCHQRGVTILKDARLVTAVKGGLLDVR